MKNMQAGKIIPDFSICEGKKLVQYSLCCKIQKATFKTQ